MANETLENTPGFTSEAEKIDSIVVTMLRSTTEAISEMVEAAKAGTEEYSVTFDAGLLSNSTVDRTARASEFSENVTTTGGVEMFPHMDENVGNYIALGFFFAFSVSVIILVSVVIFCCLKRRKKMQLEKSMVKIENPIYALRPSKYPQQSFDFLSSQNCRAEFKNRKDESSATLITVEATPPRVTVSVDNQSIGTCIHSTGSDKGESKRLSKASDYPGASVVSIRCDSDASVCPRDGSEKVGLASAGKSPSAGKKGLADSPAKRRAPVASVDYDETESNLNSESLSHPLLSDSKNFNRFSKSKESETAEEEDEVYEDENATDQTTSLLKSKEQSMLSLGSYDQSLNPFCN